MRSPFLPALLLSAALAGCAGADLSALGIKKAEPGTPNGFSFTPAASTASPGAGIQTRSLIGSEIDGLLKKHPITNSQRPETWPRVAITLVSASPALFKTVSFGGNATLSATDCAVYNVRVWSDAKTDKRYDGLKLCYGELYARLQKVPLYQVPTWGRRSFWPDERNSGSVRGDGPVPPADHFPNDPQLQQLWMDQYKNTLAFVGGPLAIIGLNWNDVTDKRVWFVSVPAQ